MGQDPLACAPAPAAIVLHGPTSAGKSSVARALQDSAPVPAFHVALDAFVTMAFARDYDLVIDTSTCSAEEGAAAIRRFIQRHPRAGF